MLTSDVALTVLRGIGILGNEPWTDLYKGFILIYYTKMKIQLNSLMMQITGNYILR